jgi:transcriptional regulator with XRE-family HTH domain
MPPTEGIPMKKKYTTVAQVVRETAEGSFAQAFEERLSDRRLVKDLMILRAGRGLTQADVAEKMGCTQSRISKLESAKDVDLTLGDLAKYAEAVGFRLTITLKPLAEIQPCRSEDGESVISLEIIESEPRSQPGPRVPQPARWGSHRDREKSKPAEV